MIDAKAIGSPRARRMHQQIITETIVAMHSEVRARRGWSILYEATVTDNPYDNYPDIIISDEQDNLQLSLEISRKSGMTYDRRKCLHLKQRFPRAEFYIYNYEMDTLFALGDNSTWYDSHNYEIRSRLFRHPVIDYIFVPEC